MASARRAKRRPDAGTAPDTKQRQCLMCLDTFASRWSGERVCPRCKGTSTWREGNSAEFVSSGSRR